MSIYSDKLAHAQVVINCLYSIAQLCTCEANSGYMTIVLYEYDHFSYPIHIWIVKSYLIIFEYEYEFSPWVKGTRQLLVASETLPQRLFEGKTLLNKLWPLLDLRAELVLRLTKSFFD